MQKLKVDHGGFTAGGTAEGLAATRVIQRVYLGSMFVASCTNMINGSFYSMT